MSVFFFSNVLIHNKGLKYRVLFHYQLCEIEIDSTISLCTHSFDPKTF